MPTLRSVRRLAPSIPVLGIAMLAAPLSSGCELFVHFDRSRIGAGDTGSVDGGRADGAMDSGTDGGGVDMGTVDMGAVDMGALDMGTDDTGTVDMGVDMGAADMGTDTGPRPDTGVDAGCSDPLLDCPATGNECIVATCTAGACGTMNLGMTHVLSTGQMANDCHVVVCNGSGGTTTIVDDTDTPVPATCHVGICTAGVPSTPPATMGTTCSAGGGHVCDGSGNCVDCNSMADCSGGTPACDTATHTCVACLDDSTCSGATPACNTATNACVACTATNATACTGGTPVCNTAANTCVQCNTDPDCVAMGMTTCTAHVCS